jgi:hypothetical protein
MKWASSNLFIFIKLFNKKDSQQILGHFHQDFKLNLLYNKVKN